MRILVWLIISWTNVCLKFVAHELPLRTVFGAKGWVYWRRIAHVLELYVKVSPDIWVQGQISTPSDLSSFVRASWNCRSVGTLPQELKKKTKKRGFVYEIINLLFSVKSKWFMLFMIKSEITKAAGERLNYLLTRHVSP